MDKAKRRIKRFIKSGKKQARVYTTAEPNVYEYKDRHHVTHLFFKADKLARLRLLK